MAVLHTYACPKCDTLFVDRWSDDIPHCCGQEAKIAFVKRENNLALGASAEKVGGARNEEHLNTGRIYSFGS